MEVAEQDALDHSAVQEGSGAERSGAERKRRSLAEKEYQVVTSREFSAYEHLLKMVTS